MASSARRLDGTACAAAIRAELAPQVDAFRREAGRPPTLHIVLVGDDPASHVYVRNKERTGGEAGLGVTVHRLPASSAARRRAGSRRGSSMATRPATASWCSRRSRRRWASTPRSRCSTRSIRPRTSTAFIPTTSAGSCRAARRSCRARRQASSSCSSASRSPSPGGTPSSSAGARSSASRWRCCCCSATRP